MSTLGNAIRQLKGQVPIDAVCDTLADWADKMERELKDSERRFELAVSEGLESSEEGLAYLERVKAIKKENAQLKRRILDAQVINYKKFDGPRDYRDAVSRVLIGLPAEIEK